MGMSGQHGYCDHGFPIYWLLAEHTTKGRVVEESGSDDLH
jgi:hypothetical protein